MLLWINKTIDFGLRCICSFLGYRLISLDFASRPPNFECLKSEKSYDGVVKVLDDDYGLINDDIFFDRHDIIFSDIQIGTKVCGKAEYKRNCWIACTLIIDEDFLLENKNKMDYSDDEEMCDISINNDGNLVFIAIVEYIYGDTLCTSDGFKYNLSHAKWPNFPMEKGDSVKVEAKQEEDQEAMFAENAIWSVIKISHTASKVFVADVTNVVRNGVIFNYDIRCDSRLCGNLRRADRRLVSMVENRLYDCKWRAVDVKKFSSKAKPVIEVASKERSENFTETMSSQFPVQSILPSEMERKIDISCRTCICLDSIYKTKMIPITLRPIEDITVTSISIVCEENMSQLHVTEDSLYKFPCSIKSGEKQTFYVACDSKIHGASNETIYIHIGNDLLIKKTLTVFVGNSSDEDYLLQYNSETRSSHKIRSVSSSRPSRFRRNYLPECPIPKGMEEEYLNRNFTPYHNILNQNLIYDNYVKKQKLFLYFEEIEKRFSTSKESMSNVKLERQGSYYVMPVCGSSEKLLTVGDCVCAMTMSHFKGRDKSVLCYEAFIHQIEGSKLYLKFSEVGSILEEELFHIYFEPSRTPFRRCHKAIVVAVEKMDMSNPFLFPDKLYFSDPQTTFQDGDFIVKSSLFQEGDEIPKLKWCTPLLNPEQKSAVRNILIGKRRPVPYIIFGPPGTGKTHTLVEAVLQIFKLIKHSKILVIAPSNSACDIVAERLWHSGILDHQDIVRLNGFYRQKQILPESIQELCVNIDTYEQMQLRRIVVTTAVSAGLLEKEDADVEFTHLFIDEAGHMTEPETCIPIQFINPLEGQIILAGDPRQLGPVIFSHIALNHHFGVSMLQRLCANHLYQPDLTDILDTSRENDQERYSMELCSAYDSDLITLLCRNYRSHPALIEVPSQLFYDQALVPTVDIGVHNKYLEWPLIKDRSPLLFLATYGKDYNSGSSDLSWANDSEAEAVKFVVEDLFCYGVTPQEIGIITPYRRQIRNINRYLCSTPGTNDITIGTVERFQGQERPVIILSTVRSNNSYRRNTLGFVSRPERFNVSITRAMSLLIVIGNPETLSSEYNWEYLMKYCVQKNSLIRYDMLKHYYSKNAR